MAIGYRTIHSRLQIFTGAQPVARKRDFAGSHDLYSGSIGAQCACARFLQINSALDHQVSPFLRHSLLKQARVQQSATEVVPPYVTRKNCLWEGRIVTGHGMANLKAFVTYFPLASDSSILVSRVPSSPARGSSRGGLPGIILPH